MSPSLANFLFEACNFLLLAALLGWVAFKPARAAVEHERERHVQSEAEQKRLLDEARTAAEQARAALAAADRESSARRQQLLAAAEQDAARILERAKRDQAAARSSWEQELERARSAQALGWAELVGRIASASLSRLLEAIEGPPLDLALVRAACGELHASAGAARAPALVEAARPLSPEARALLQAALPAGFEERTLAELLAGVRITTAAGQVDATALSIARQAARAVTAAATPEPAAARPEPAAAGPEPEAEARDG